jgi:hypothetical protein
VGDRPKYQDERTTDRAYPNHILGTSFCISTVASL